MPEFPHTPHQYHVVRLALKTAYAENKMFTRKSFALMCGVAENRHTAAALDALVVDGLLCRWRIEFLDARERYVYTRPPGSKDMEVLNHFWQEIRQFINEDCTREQENKS